MQYHEVLHAEDISTFNCPAYYIAGDNLNKELVLVFRGTKSMSDVCTDLTTHCKYLKRSIKILIIFNFIIRLTYEYNYLIFIVRDISKLLISVYILGPTIVTYPYSSLLSCS